MNDILACGNAVLTEEARAIARLAEHLTESFVEAITILQTCEGKVVVSGIGKSGHIARKCASTLASTGTPAFFVNPAECLHGDFGMIAKGDVVILISKSGEAREITEIVPYLKRASIPFIAITNNKEGFLAKNANATVLLHIEKEVCPLNLAPTTSSTVTLALTDAIAVTLMELRGFSEEDFALLHPAGSLGKQLTTVERIMHKENDLPFIYPWQTMRDVLPVIIEKKLGAVIVINEADGTLLGIIVDGDLKRILLEYGTSDFFTLTAEEVMTKNPMTIGKETLISEALARMEGKITSLIIAEDRKPIGFLHIHDILKYKAI